jgi:uncharacterized protein (DUF1684 family)
MPAASTSTHELLDLLEWKRAIFALYAEVRAAPSPLEAWKRWREVRDDLFRDHPQSPLPSTDREGFSGLAYFAYDAELRVTGEIVPLEPHEVGIGASNGRPIAFERFAQVRFELDGDERSLDAYWLDAYGGGLFLPFADATAGEETYPAGRYLLDTVKGADLGGDGNELVLDFNFAYNPSCAYDPSWACPLAPPANRLDVPIRGGERRARRESASIRRA